MIYPIKKFISTCCLASLVFLCFAVAFAAEPRLIIEPEDGEQPILAAIHQAHSSIDLAMYGFTDEAIMQALIEAKQQGKKVRLLLQHFPYNAIDENLPAIERFSKFHLNYNFPSSLFYLLHQKTLIIDQHMAMIMTFNFTRSTFKKQRNFAVVITEPALVKEIQQVFDADWLYQRSTPLQPQLLWSPDNSRSKIVALIKSAHQTINMYAQGLSDQQVVATLTQVAQQGVKVQILTSQPLAPAKQAALQRAGVKLHLSKQFIIHAKVIIVDQQKALLGSINFTAPSLEKNRELSIIIDNAQVVAQLQQVFRQDWKFSPNMA